MSNLEASTGQNLATPDNGNGYTRKQLAAIKHGERLAGIVDREQVIALFRGKRALSYGAIARELLPKNFAAFPGSATAAIRYVVHEDVPQEERDTRNKENMATFLMEAIHGLGSEKYRKHQSEASKARHALGIPVNTIGVIQGRGRTPWTDFERETVQMAATVPAFQYKKGRHIGSPNYAMIAGIINDNIHGGEIIRTTSSIK